MGFLPVIIAVGGFFGLWTGLMVSSFRKYLERANIADAARRALLARSGTDPEAVNALPDADLGKAFGRLNLGPDLLKAEVAFRSARRTYNKLVTAQPYRQVAAVAGYKPL